MANCVDVMPHVFNISGVPIFPAKMHQHVLGLMYVDESLPLVRMHHSFPKIHFPRSKLHQMRTGMLDAPSVTAARREQSHNCSRQREALSIQISRLLQNNSKKGEWVLLQIDRDTNTGGAVKKR